MSRYLDLKGKRFGKLTALHRIEDGEKGYAKWLCKCDCGGEIIVDTKRLQRGTVTNCGCEPKKTAGNGSIAEDLTGRRFGKLVVVRRAENKNGRVRWLCQCDCGHRAVFTAKQLKAGQTTSCGCQRKRHLHYKNLRGRWFGRLTALYPTAHRDKKGSIKWKCRCACGNECLVTEDALVHGNTRSCGCRKTEVQGAVFKKVSLYEGTSYTLLKYRNAIRSDNASGYTGVYENKNGKYKAVIGFKGKVYHLGTHDTLQAAAAMRRYAEKILHQGFCEAFERWKVLSRGDPAWETDNPLIYEVSFKDREFDITCNIEALEKEWAEER
ncbi:AP2 domain protein [Pseudoramibacter alactolyticus ATCC 23263]|uniref:AP2 domain protein n=1 Tax=Pseudoramibacter alactolyticus ATCC 23263 TaxID=887929 RepID=E6MJB2_9FIRM|nr:AP2 domain-containing protein [Pseudoramibacter alactolyticus]EFV00789.1 AP2 domain protein [Pseudoramibacter alactolyticus ATCC 23263]